MKQQDPTALESAPLRQRLWRSIVRETNLPATDQGRMRRINNDLILHLHPPRVSRRALRFTYTFGLGGLSILLLVVLVLTGVMLAFVYTPTPEDAYGSIVALQNDIWFGQLIRNLHHWSANLLLITAFAHLLRVFYTGAFRPPREFNWQLGLSLLGLIALANFTGYLLPWDQLSYWAVTVGTSLLGYIPLIGEPLKTALLGGPEVGASTLTNFYALHVLVIPLGLAFITSFHIWRVRKDKISRPRHLDEAPPPNNDTVTTIPYLISIEVAVGLIALALLLGFATWMDAPLLAAANPNHPPDPAKAAWYFMGAQEMLLHFHPIVPALFFPALVIGGLVALPYLREDADTTGIWFRSRRGRWLAPLALLLGIGAAVILVLLSEYDLTFAALLPFLPGSISGGVIPLAVGLGLVWLFRAGLRRIGAGQGEIRLAVFTLLLGAFLALTVIGVFFRGAGMGFVIPWEAVP